MNTDDLREQLERMAGPAPRVTSDARQDVRRRVTGARRKRGAVSAISAVLVAALIAVGVHNATENKQGVRTINSTTASTAATGPQCDLGIATVPADQVPSDVAKWASDAPVVGGGELWAVRSILLGPENHDSAVYRMKVSWFTRPFGIPMFSGRRLDGPGTFQGRGDQAIDTRGEWVASTLEFSTPGCWEVTARYDQSTITYRVLVGAPPQPLAIGTITGTMRVIGGPAPGENRAIDGTIRVAGAAGSWSVPTRASSGFRLDVPAGTYTVTGGPGLGGCSAGREVAVRRGGTTTVEVTCNIP